MKGRAKRVAVLATLVAVLVAATCAFAARLPLRSADLFTTSTTHPCPGTGSVTPVGTGVTSTSGVSVSLPAATCSGRPVQVTVLSPTGAVLAQGAATVSGSRAEVTLSGPIALSQVATVKATAGGWSLPLTWSYTGSDPVAPGNTPTELSPLTWTLTTNNPVQACFSSRVSTTSTTPVDWRVTLDLSRAPFNGASPSGFQLQGSDAWRYRWYTNSPSAGFLQIGGTATGGRATVVAGQSYDVMVCNWGLPPGAQTPSAYSVSSARTTWTTTRACVSTTVTGNGSEKFYFAWTAQVDMRPAIDKLASGGRALSAYTYGGNEWMLTRSPAPGAPAGVFQVVSSSPANLHLTETFTFETCAVSY